MIVERCRRFKNGVNGIRKLGLGIESLNSVLIVKLKAKANQGLGNADSICLLDLGLNEAKYSQALLTPPSKTLLVT